MLVASPARAEHALIAPAQGNDSVRASLGAKALDAVANALRAHKITSSVDVTLGETLVACEDPTCTEKALASARADIGFVLAAWKRRDTGETELTLTLLDRNARSINARAIVGNRELTAVAAELVDTLLKRRDEGPTLTPLPSAAPSAKRDNGWLAGPVVLLAAGAGLVTAAGVGVARKGCARRDAGGCAQRRVVNTGTVAAVGALGAAALAGGITWWVVGKNKRRERKQVAVGISPSRVEFRLAY